MRKHSKKGQEKTIINILIMLVSLAILVSLIKTCMMKGDEVANENICRASVALRERSQFEVGPVDVDKYTPLLCITQEKQIPKNKDDDKQAVMKQMADSMVRCRWMFGDGVIEDIFAEGSRGFENECFICYLVSTDTKDGYKFDETITGPEFYEFLATTPYLVESDSDNCYIGGGGYCVESATACSTDERLKDSYDYREDAGACKTNPNGPVCCYSTLECVRKGGTCLPAGQHPKDDQVGYPGWACDKESQCYVNIQNRYTYSEYLQFYRGYSNYIVPTNIEPNKLYAIAWGSPNQDDCEWCTTAATFGVVLGATAAVIFVPGAGVAIVAVKLAGGAIAGATVLGGGTYAVELAINEIEELISGRNMNTVYLFPYDGKAAEVCNVVED